MGEFVFKMNEPKDYEYLLLCDGSTISEENYPELVAVLGGTQLPNLIDRVVQGSATAGTYKAAGLPNITGSGRIGDESVSTGILSTQGALYPSGSTSVGRAAHSGSYHNVPNITFSAQASNPIYGASTTVQPPAYTAKIYICYAG